MIAAVGLINLVIGAVYTSYGLITIHDLRRRRAAGRSLFGYAWILMAFTCGPHHLDHGAHALVHGHAGPLDLLAIVVGLPTGVAWFYLRMEALTGRGVGDRTIQGSPAPVEVLPALGIFYLLAFTTWTMRTVDPGLGFDVRIMPNVLLVGFYGAIGYVLLKTQLLNHARTGTWSLSGLSLTFIFPTCALMHSAWALYGAEGRYPFHSHLLVIDILAVPAAAFFLWVVWSLGRGSLSDWRSGLDTSLAPLPAPRELSEVGR